MAVSTMDGLVAALTAGETRTFMKNSQTSEGAGTWHSLWTATGYPGAGAAQGSLNGAICNDATTGGFPFVNAAGAANNYLGYISAASSVAGTLIVYDRLWHNSTLNGTLTTAQNITQPALTRFTDGAGVELWLEIYSAWGSTAATATISYTDQDGNAAQSGTIAYPAGVPSVGQMLPATLASGDYGVRAVASLTLNTSTLTAGNAGLTLMKRLVTIPLPQINVAAVYDAFSTGLREIPDDACIAMMVQCTAATTGVINGELTIAKG
jgi:hypothetical protein